MFMRVLYSVFLGILVTLFVAWAMAAWYSTPRWETEYPDVEHKKEPPILPSEQELSILTLDERIARLQEYEESMTAYEEWKATRDELQEEFDKKLEVQGRNVALISLLFAVILTAASLWYSGRLQAIAEGMLLGGIFTLMYSIGWCIARAPTIAVLVVGVGLVVTIVIGYMKFVPKPAN